MAPHDTVLDSVPQSQWLLFDVQKLLDVSSVDQASGSISVPRTVDGMVSETFSPSVDARLLGVYERANDPLDPYELRDLYLGRIEDELGTASHRPELAAQWRAARPKRSFSVEEVLQSRSTIRFVKELFNWFFRDDLYGALRADSHIILSSGSVDEASYGLPKVLKECVQYALARDWYGYSDSRGRLSTREAIAAYESARSGGGGYNAANVAITMGGTFAISALVDFIALHGGVAGPAICAIPNYPPLVETVGRRMPVSLVPTPCYDGVTSLEPVIAALTPSTPLVLLQTVTNPTGAPVDEHHLERLIAAASPSTMILLDECHECLGPPQVPTSARMARNVVRVSSISKTWSAPGLKLGWILASSDFVDDYYEYASTTFGGPPSLFYTLLEVMVRMERWLIEDIDTPGGAELAEFEISYGLTAERLARAYSSYRIDRIARETALVRLREAAVAGIAGPTARVVRPRYSINMAVEFSGIDDSYGCFRRLLGETGIAVFPGILTFCLGGGSVRLTTARTWSDLGRSINAIAHWGEVHGARSSSPAAKVATTPQEGSQI